MNAPFRKWCADRIDEAHRISLTRWAERAGDGDHSLDEALGLSTLNHKLRQTIADQRTSQNRSAR